MNMIFERYRKGAVLSLLIAVLMMFPAVLCAEIIRVTGKVEKKKKPSFLRRGTFLERNISNKWYSVLKTAMGGIDLESVDPAP